MKIGGIYIDKSYTEDDIKNGKIVEFCLHIGRNQLAFFANGSDIYDLYQDVEVGGESGVKELTQCTFGINNITSEWHIKDNTNNKIIAKGKYHNDVEKQVKSFIKQMTGV